MTRFPAFVVLMTAGCCLPPSANAAPKPHSAKKTMAAPAQYQAACGMVYSAAEAKKDHYICPMDHKKMVPIMPAAKGKAPTP